MEQFSPFEFASQWALPPVAATQLKALLIQWLNCCVKNELAISQLTTLLTMFFIKLHKALKLQELHQCYLLHEYLNR